MFVSDAAKTQSNTSTQCFILYIRQKYEQLEDVVDGCSLRDNLRNDDIRKNLNLQSVLDLSLIHI